MRKQFHFRPSQNGFYAWDVHRLIELSSSLDVATIAINLIAEVDEPYWFYTGDIPTCRKLAEHFNLMKDADLSYPIILCAEGRVMDGMHRVTKAVSEGKNTIECVRFAATPKADFMDIQPAEVFSLIEEDDA